MPPVFGPASPSKARLKSCAASSGTAAVPSASANSDTSGPSRNSSMTTVPQARACRTASRRSPVTTTPLPAASPSAFTTWGGPNASRAASTSAWVTHVRAAAVGTPAAAMTCLANDFDPSIIAAARPGPKQAMPAARTASATPATSGASGPMTTSSAPTLAARAVTLPWSAGATSWISAIVAIPGLPGAACRLVTPASRASARTRACSRPPEPMTRTRTAASLPPAARLPGTRRDDPAPALQHRSDQGAELERLVAARAHSDPGQRGADHVLDRPHVGLRAPGEIPELPGRGEVLPPAVQVLVDRLRVVEVRLRHGDLVVPGPVHVVGHADRHPLQAGQHVELGEEVVGDPVDAGRVPGDDRVEPAGAAGPARGDAVLLAGLPQPLAFRAGELGRERARAHPGRVGLDDPDHLGDPGRPHPRARAGPARRGRRRGHERVGPVIHVQLGRLRALEQHHLLLVQRLVDDQARVGHVTLQPLEVGQVLRSRRLGVDPAPVVDLGEHLVLLAQRQLELLAQD